MANHESVWPMRIFVLVFALAGLVDLATDGVTLQVGFHLLGALGFVVAGTWDPDRPVPPARRGVGYLLVAVAVALLLVDLFR